MSGCPLRGDELHSAAIITTGAGAKTKQIHDRMPVILHPEDWGTWLSTETEKDELKGLLKSAPDNGLEMYPVSTRINTATYDEPDCVGAVT